MIDLGLTALDPHGLIDRTRAALAQCTFLPFSQDKRFARQVVMVPLQNLSDRQVHHILRMAYRYRRQMPRDLVPAVDVVAQCDQADAIARTARLMLEADDRRQKQQQRELKRRGQLGTLL